MKIQLQFLVRFFVGERFYAQKLYSDFNVAHFAGQQFATRFLNADYLIYPENVGVL